MITADIENKMEVPIGSRLLKMHQNYLSGPARKWINCRIREVMPLVYWNKNKKYKAPKFEIIEII